MQLYYWILYFFVYGVLGWCTEVAYAAFKEGKFVNRGFLNGPICPVYGIGVGVVVQFLMPFRGQLVVLYIASTILVTIIEGLTGFILDKLFHHRWWDYSKLPFNIGGYVCLLFSLIWGVACVFIVQIAHPVIHKGLTLIPFYMGIVLIIVLGIGMFADLYVTASTILKFNKRLDAMDKIATELHEISDKMGENIYENVMNGMEIHDESKKRLDAAAEELKQAKERLAEAKEEERQKWEQTVEEKRIRLEAYKTDMLIEKKQRLAERKEELQAKYGELAGYRNRVSTRLMKAFPHMDAPGHEQILKELREALENRK